MAFKNREKAEKLFDKDAIYQSYVEIINSI